MADKKSMIQSLNDLSQKIKAMSNGAEVRIQSDSSAMKNLQTQINQQEEERLKYLQSRLSDYFEPLTQDIEKDEEDLLKAYNLFCQMMELNKTAVRIYCRASIRKFFAFKIMVCRKKS